MRDYPDWEELTDPTEGMSEEEYIAFWELPAAAQNAVEEETAEGEFPW